MTKTPKAVPMAVTAGTDIDTGTAAATPEIVAAPIAEIEVLNPRARNRRVFEELVESIVKVGLKKPITVARRHDGPGYELVCGQGRMEAFAALGETTIPAIVIDASREDYFVMSLVENLARRQHTPLELIREVGVLKQRGYSVAEIARKTGFSPEYTWSICFLLERGEERLLDAVERGVVPYGIAIEIARAEDVDVQRALTEAYETKELPGAQILAIRRIVDERNQIGKGVTSVGRVQKSVKPTAAALVRTYQKEVDRQKLLVKKAELAQGRLIFAVNALKKLLDEEHFLTLLRAEGMATLPQPLAERLGLAEA